MDLNSCRFCNIILNYKISESESIQIPICDTLLFETENFIVIPALGALVPGYLMIVARNHLHSMAYCSEDELIELTGVIKYLNTLIEETLSISPILFEHGSAIGCVNKSGCCVEHAHLHIVPVNLSEESKIVENTNAVKIPDLQALRIYCGKPYLLYINENNQYYISSDTILPSQFMRQWVAKEIGCPLEYDWRRFEFIDNISTTVELFKGNNHDIVKNIFSTINLNSAFKVKKEY